MIFPQCPNKYQRTAGVISGRSVFYIKKAKSNFVYLIGKQFDRISVYNCFDRQSSHYVQATKEKNHKHTLYWAKQPRYNNLISITFYNIQRKLREIVDKLKDLCYNYKYNRDGTIKYIEIYKNSNFVIVVGRRF